MEESQDSRVVEAVKQEWTRLRAYVRKRVSDPSEVEDILQDVFCELIEAYRAMQPVREAGRWLFRVARNRIIDRFRKKSTEAASISPEGLSWEELLPSGDDGPEAAYVRSVLLEELEDALAELPPEQREVFLANEVEGISFKDIAERTGVNINTLLARKRYAVLHLRQRLKDIHDEFTGGQQ